MCFIISNNELFGNRRNFINLHVCIYIKVIALLDFVFTLIATDRP